MLGKSVKQLLSLKWWFDGDLYTLVQRVKNSLKQKSKMRPEGMVNLTPFMNAKHPRPCQEVMKPIIVP